MKIFTDSNHIIIHRIQPYLAKMGCRFYPQPAGCDVYLAFVHIKSTNLPTVLRLDGIYYDSDTDYNSRNAGISQAHKLADAVIYQSHFSRSMCEKYLSPRKKEAKPFVIHNGIDNGWCGKFVEHEGTNIIVTAKWRRHKRLQETIQLFLQHHKKYPHSHLHIFGLLHNNIPIKHSNIHYYGHVDRKDFMVHHSMADFTIHLSKKDACPNSVVEAIGAGIPVITTDACGGSTEMCEMTKGCIVCDGDTNSIEPCKPYTDTYNILPKALENNLLDAMQRIENNKYRVELPKELSAEYVAEKYFEVFRSII